jgi:hypothetical protein
VNFKESLQEALRASHLDKDRPQIRGSHFGHRFIGLIWVESPQSQPRFECLQRLENDIQEALDYITRLEDDLVRTDVALQKALKRKEVSCPDA